MKKLHFKESAAFLLAGVFLFNPNINIIDFLPDLVAYALLLYGTRRLSEIVPAFSEARTRLRRMLFISIAKLPALLIMLSIFFDGSDQGAIITVFSFGFAVLETVFIIPVLQKLYDGFAYLGTRFSCNKALRGLDGLYKLSLVFFILRAAFSTLPDFALITSGIFAFEGFSGNQFNKFTYFYPWFVGVAFLLCLIVGCLWLIRYREYIHRTFADKELASLLSTHESDYATVTKKRNYCAGLKTVLTLTVCAMVFLWDFFLDRANVLPDILSAVLLFVAVLLSRKYTDYAKRLLPLTVLYGVVTTVNYFMTAEFYSNYAFASIGRHIAATELYQRIIAVSLLELATLLAVLVLLWLMIRDIIRRHAGQEYTDPYHQKINEKTQKALRKRSTLFLVFAALSSGFALLDLYLKQFNVNVSASDKYFETGLATIPAFSFISVFPFIFSALCLVMGIWLYSGVITEAERKYL